jgi:hypothetical protein
MVGSVAATGSGSGRWPVCVNGRSGDRGRPRTGPRRKDEPDGAARGISLDRGLNRLEVSAIPPDRLNRKFNQCGGPNFGGARDRLRRGFGRSVARDRHAPPSLCA